LNHLPFLFVEHRRIW